MLLGNAMRSHVLREQVFPNQGVAGSSPAGVANEIKGLAIFEPNRTSLYPLPILRTTGGTWVIGR